MAVTKDEALEALNECARQLDRAEGRRISAILDALLAGASQREVAQWSRLSVNTVRAIMQDAGIEYGGMRYVITQPTEQVHDPRCISLTDSEFSDHCDCATLRLIDAHQPTVSEEDHD